MESATQHKQHISKETAQRIKEAAERGLIEVASKYLAFKKKGVDHVADCPLCGAKGKFSVSATKDIWKCWKCDEGGIGAIDFLMKTQDLSYPDALKIVAREFNVDLGNDTEGSDVMKSTVSKKPFRDLQLLASGIPADAVKWNEKIGSGKVIERSRYEQGSVNEMFNLNAGDDMILNYLDLKGEAVMYNDAKGKTKRYFRVRWQNPELHKSKAGKPMKYQSPSRSSSQLWLPNAIIAAYSSHQTFETLYVTEGEKKADKMTLHGLQTVGIGGIHNLTFEGMSSQLEMLLKRCEVKNVVFLLDSDWQGLSKNEDNVDWRPKTFASAVVKFRDYFYGYKNAGIELRIFFAYGKDVVLKGADDLLVHQFLGKEIELEADFERARIDREGKGQYVNVHEITLTSPQKIYEHWHLHNAQSFLDFHKDALKLRREFVYNKQRWTWNEEAEGGARFEMVDKILEYEKYWTIEEVPTRTGMREALSFNYYNCLQFLRNRGFGLYDLGKNKYRMIRTEGKVVKEVDHHRIQQFIKAFTEDLGEIGVLNMILKGGTQYLGPDKLSNMYYTAPEFSEPEKEAQYLYFPKKYWKITADGIEEHPLSELPKTIWADKIINFEPSLLAKPLVSISRVKGGDTEGWSIQTSEEGKKTDMYQFMLATSNFWWRKNEVMQKGENGRDVIVPRSDGGELLTAQERQDLITHVVCKMIAAGYVLHEYRNKAQMKAIIAMDGIESEVGKSQGGSGKSIYATMFEHLMPTVVIDGKKRNIAEDPHIYDGVDERTNILVFDDCRVNLDFEHFFSQITRGVEVNQKGQRRFNIPAPKFIFSTNHAIRGSDNSTMRRQYLLGFSDYFNAARTPQDTFGRLMFNEWDYEEWNRFYNFMATCIQTYLKFPDLNKYTIPTADLEKRKLRQEIGENFLEFAELYFSADEDGDPFNNDPQCYRNLAVEKRKVLIDYTDAFPNDKKYMDEKRIKEKVRLYCKYMGFEFNPTAGTDGRVKFGKTEYLLVTDENFDRKNVRRVG